MTDKEKLEIGTELLKKVTKWYDGLIEIPISDNFLYATTNIVITTLSMLEELLPQSVEELHIDEKQFYEILSTSAMLSYKLGSYYQHVNHSHFNWIRRVNK